MRMRRLLSCGSTTCITLRFGFRVVVENVAAALGTITVWNVLAEGGCELCPRLVLALWHNKLMVKEAGAVLELGLATIWCPHAY